MKKPITSARKGLKGKFVPIFRDGELRRGPQAALSVPAPCASDLVRGIMDKDIRLDHGSGGLASKELVENVLLKRLYNLYLRSLDDSAAVPFSGSTMAVTTDSYVVDPIFFPGGNIGTLSIYGTINDLAMQGARPLYLTLGLIIEEGFPIEHLILIVDEIARASNHTATQVVAGDTKVVNRGQMDKIFINTSGIGLIPEGIDVSSRNAKPGDAVLINGTIGDHGLTILTQREGLSLKGSLSSDTAPLYQLVNDLLLRVPQVHVLRDPTRGGVATALNEIALQSTVGITIREDALPVSKPVRAASEILGLDPLYVANEGKCLVFVPDTFADLVLQTLRNSDHGAHSARIGHVTEENPGRVLLETRVGGTRIVPTLTGEQLPRIC